MDFHPSGDTCSTEWALSYGVGLTPLGAQVPDFHIFPPICNFRNFPFRGVYVTEGGLCDILGLLTGTPSTLDVPVSYKESFHVQCKFLGTPGLTISDDRAPKDEQKITLSLGV